MGGPRWSPGRPFWGASREGVAREVQVDAGRALLVIVLREEAEATGRVGGLCRLEGLKPECGWAQVPRGTWWLQEQAKGATPHLVGQPIPNGIGRFDFCLSCPAQHSEASGNLHSVGGLAGMGEPRTRASKLLPESLRSKTRQEGEPSQSWKACRGQITGIGVLFSINLEPFQKSNTYS